MPTTRKIVSIVGARPQFVKLGPVARSLASKQDIKHLIVHTGQHYDEGMSEVFFEQLKLPRPDINLKAGSASQAVQTANIMTRLESYFLHEKPTAVIVYGDTNSTLAAALTAVKIHIPVVHIEAGLRSFNREMPEEINRLVADHTCDRLYAPTPAAVEHLRNENLSEQTVLSGDVMRDAVEFHRQQAESSSRIMQTLELEANQYAVATIHRPSNTDGSAFQGIVEILDTIATQQLPVVFPVHPRSRHVLHKLGDLSPQLRLLEPLPYLDMLQLVANARVVATDSGGLQKEAAFLHTPCITFREETEWVETVSLGINHITGVNPERIHSALEHVLSSTDPFTETTRSELDRCYGSGTAACNITTDLLQWLS